MLIKRRQNFHYIIVKWLAIFLYGCINIFNYKSNTGLWSGPKIFFSTDSNSTTQDYPKTIYLTTLLIYTCPSPILQIQSPVLAYRVTWDLFSQQIQVLHPKITLEWYIGRVYYLFPDKVQINDILGPFLASCWPPLVKFLKRPIFPRLHIKYRKLL